MRTVLVTGAAGEIGTALIEELSEQHQVVAFDIRPRPSNTAPQVEWITGDILDPQTINSVFTNYKIDTIFHLAAILSTAGEENPLLAHNVNVNGFMNLLQAAQNCEIIFPSTIAVYGLPSLQAKISASKVKEDTFLRPTTMYGINKLYCENVGRYYEKQKNIDFRCLRFPGLISSETLPSGGTTDYAPEMIHSAARREAYICFVREDTKLPFMVMPDAIQGLIKLMNVPRENLGSSVYNINGFTATAREIEEKVKQSFPKAQISYESNTKRQQIVDSWPAEVDDSYAKKDWDWQPEYDFEKAFSKYLIPNILKKYQANG